VVAGVALLLAAAGAAWWLWPRPEPVAPPMPAVEDDEVRAAVERARKQVLANPASAEAWGRLGKVLLAHMLVDDADVCLAEAARLDPDDPRWLYARGWLAVRHDPQKPVGLLREALAKSPARSPVRSAMALQLAEALRERGDEAEAEKFFQEELRLEPNNARAALGLGLIAADRGDVPAAQEYLTLAGGSPFARKRASVRLGALARARGNNEAADRLEKHAAQLPEDPPWPDPLNTELASLRVGWRWRARRARRLEQQRRFAEAAAVYLEQIEQHPTVEAYLGAGMCYAGLRDFDRAVPLLRAALQRGPDNPQAHFCLALALYSRAEEKLWPAAPGSARAKESFREASDRARRAAELRPEHAQSYLVWGMSLKYLGELSKAVELLRQAAKRAPSDFQIQLGLGEALLEAGQLKEAAGHLENARRLAPNDPRPGRALERLRQKKEASS
jgi:tetratricopeptide (TPR) repeat protein